MRSYQELSLDERIVIQLQHGEGQSMRSIGRSINRSASTVENKGQVEFPLPSTCLSVQSAQLIVPPAPK
jgi:Helix-turn-helix domain